MYEAVTLPVWTTWKMSLSVFEKINKGHELKQKNKMEFSRKVSWGGWTCSFNIKYRFTRCSHQHLGLRTAPHNLWTLTDITKSEHIPAWVNEADATQRRQCAVIARPFIPPCGFQKMPTWTHNVGLTCTGAPMLVIMLLYELMKSDIWFQDALEGRMICSGENIYKDGTYGHYFCHFFAIWLRLKRVQLKTGLEVFL